MSKCIFILTWWMACLASPLLAGPFQVGAGRASLTPDPQMRNWVGGAPYEGVLDPLYARAVVLSDETNEVVLLTWDLVDAGEAAVERTRKLIEAELHIPADHILVNASHTHSAPWSPLFSTNLLPNARKTQLPVEAGPVYQSWSGLLLQRSLEAARQARANRRGATAGIARANVSEWLFSRRLRRPDGLAETIFEPSDPYTLPRGLQFGSMDPTLTLLAFKDQDGQSIATLFQLPCHSVTIYPYHKGISADWPGPVCAALNEKLGGETLFLQGCAGDIVPARRGVKERDAMSAFIAARAEAAARQSYPLKTSGLQIRGARIHLPLLPGAAKEFGQPALASEVQVISFGPLSIVALPGEPLIDVALHIQRRSPFPHTLVLGYSNGYGVEYVGIPGEKARGGYEMTDEGAGTDECGAILIETAVRLLQESFAARPDGNASPKN